VRVYRFGVRHLFQGSASEAPVFLYRGGRIVPLSDITTPYLRALAATIAGNLQGRAWPGDEPHGMLGSYHPHADRYEPLIASPFAQSLAAFALSDYARTPGIPAAIADQALVFAKKIVQQATVVSPDEDDPLERAADASMWLIARHAIERSQEGRQLVVPPEFAQAALDRVSASVDENGTWNDAVRPSERSLVAYALLLESKRRGSPNELATKAEQVNRRLLRDADTSQLVSLMPWIGWAQLELAAANDALPGEVALRELRSLVWRHQIGETDVDGDSQDMIGGIVFTQGRASLPSWHTLRPVAFFATALSDKRLTSLRERSQELSSLRLSLRFLLQLTVDPSSGRLLPDPQRALGGVKSAPWDSTMGVEAAALGLLAACQTLESLDRFSEVR
jgi:hypothetical protein